MIDVNGHIIASLPIEGLVRVANLIEFEGPLLSHYTDRYKNNYLFYWVDHDETNNRWLIWKVEKELIYLYLSGDIPLLNLFPKSGETIYTTDIDEQLNYNKIIICYSDDIPERYMPEPDAYYTFEVPEAYEEKIKVATYLTELRQRGIYINLTAASKRYMSTLGITDILEVFENVAKSFSHYVSYTVQGILSSTMPDLARVTKVSRSLSKLERLRIIYLNLNSFHVGISADILNIDHQMMDRSVSNFSKNVLQEYKNDVLDNDFSSPEDIDILVKKYSDDAARKRIFDPVIKIINNDNIKVNITDYTKTFDKTYNRVPKIEIERLLPKSSTEDKIQEMEQELMVAYMIADKSPDRGTLFPTDANRLLYYKSSKNFPIEIDKITLEDGQEIAFKYSLKIEASFENHIFYVNFEPLNIVISAKDRPDLLAKFEKELRKMYLQYVKDESYKDFFRNLI